MKIHKNKKRKDDVTRETYYQIIVSQNKKFGIYYQIIRKNYILELKKKKKRRKIRIPDTDIRTKIQISNFTRSIIPPTIQVNYHTTTIPNGRPILTYKRTRTHTRETNLITIQREPPPPPLSQSKSFPRFRHFKNKHATHPRLLLLQPIFQPMKRRHRCHRRRRGRRHHHRPRHRHRSVPGSRLRVIFTNRWLRRNLENEAGKPYWGRPSRTGGGRTKSVVNRGVAGVARICRGRGASPGKGERRW